MLVSTWGSESILGQWRAFFPGASAFFSAGNFFLLKWSCVYTKSLRFFHFSPVIASIEGRHC